ncbi:MAG: hypothetical protein BGP12_11090 [Rhodospirillales bacterium 70-18]|nr:hypothetical protein [Rhodospirillales bacterium]OJY68281.1 MAG: hypothetical protein BGP12_11090 [Rhodospirillales bacterium 70-18]
MARLSNEDIERLASRVAMLASDDGEADNAGRAVGQLARRLGLTGGDLKHLFLFGANPEAVSARGRSAEMERLERLVAELRRDLRNMEAAARSIQEERDELLSEKGERSVLLYRSRASQRARGIALAIGVVLAVLVGGAVAMYGPDLGGRTAPALPTAGIAVVRGTRVALLREPLANAATLTSMPAGTRLVVRRVLWNMMTQWAEVEMGGLSGYVRTTDLEIF